ncbi:MAG: type IV pilus assembly protein PilM [Planctomycetes bacterium]|nr:type IV pilus assembly protein PilM [Planctomycetota bacterium]
MASVSDAVWAVDIGNSSLKALYLTLVGDSVEVGAFDTIQHSKVLSGKGVSPSEREELIALSLRKLVERHDIAVDDVIISVPSQNSFARFVTLPPVEVKKIPEIVGFEAAQQIPFDMSEVQWDWQLMTPEDSPEKRVGLFAIKNEIINAELEHFNREDLAVAYVQMAPMALYNYLLYDRPSLLKSENRPVVVLNIGAEITDLVVCTGSAVWQRCILVGGNAFTQAISDAFKINFEKAEKLKRTAAVSKYARQIFQAMRPVFTELAGEVQKSLGFYTSANADAQFSRIVAMGGGTKLRGLLKYLQQTLQVPVERPDMFKQLRLGPGVSAAKFHDSVSQFGVVYGLGVQGLGLARIETNLLPKSVVRSMAWAMKIRLFMVAACFLLLVSLMALGRTWLDKVNYDQQGDLRRQIASTIRQARDVQSTIDETNDTLDSHKERVTEMFARFRYRDAIAQVHEAVLAALPGPANNPAQEALYAAFAAGDVDAVKQIPRKERKQLFVTSMAVSFAADLTTAVFGQMGMADDGMEMSEEEMQYQMQMMEYEMEYGLEGYGTELEEAPPTVPGFLVTIEGYSPYMDIGSLLDPSGVENRPERWGFVTRLQDLDGGDPNDARFSLYQKGVITHFQLDKGFVDPSITDVRVPYGIGVPEEKEGMANFGYVQQEDMVLVDPMTQEVISPVDKLDDRGKPQTNRRGDVVKVKNDSWFILKFKLAWNEAPVIEDPMAGMMMMNY